LEDVFLVRDISAHIGRNLPRFCSDIGEFHWPHVFRSQCADYSGQSAERQPAGATWHELSAAPAWGGSGSAAQVSIPPSDSPARKICAARLLPLLFVPVAYRSEPFCNRAADTWRPTGPRARSRRARPENRFGPCESSRAKSKMARIYRWPEARGPQRRGPWIATGEIGDRAPSPRDARDRNRPWDSSSPPRL